VAALGGCDATSPRKADFEQAASVIVLCARQGASLRRRRSRAGAIRSLFQLMGRDTGTRSIDAEVASVVAIGLLPLSAVARRERLIRALSKHPDWGRFAPNLDATINSKGLSDSEGRREGKVYLTLSRSGLTDSFNHYISHGAEFDQGVVRKLMGEEGLELLARDGKPRLVHVGVPGGRALEGAHPYFDIETTRDREAAPNLVKEFLGAWTSRFANPGYQSRSIKL
jgi:hypothetical protein